MILFGEAFLFILFHVKGFYDPVSSDGFMKEGGQEPHSLLSLPGESPHPFPKKPDGNQGHRSDNVKNNRQFPALKEGDRNEAEKGEDIFENARRGAGDSSLNQRYIVRNAGDDNTGRRLCKKGEREGLKMIVECFPDVRDNLLSHKVHEVILAIIENSLE